MALKHAMLVAAQHDHAASSVTTLTSVTNRGVQYHLRVCGCGPSAYFEWVNEHGCPVGEPFYEAVDGYLSTPVCPADLAALVNEHN